MLDPHPVYYWIQCRRSHQMALALSPRWYTPRLVAPILPHFTPSLTTAISCRQIGFGKPNMESSSTAGDSSSAATETNTAAATEPEDTLVQYVVLRRDLIDTWPLGSVVTQGCHASVAAIWTHKDDEHTQLYCSPSNLDSMHKVTLEVKGETQILNLSEKLKAGNIAHKLWIEQPENFPTCLATKPYPKSFVSSYFKKLKLCK